MNAHDDEGSSSCHKYPGRRHEQAGAEPDGKALVRRYAERRHQLHRDIVHVAHEYQRRIREEGQNRADQWLAETALAMGRSDGAMARKLLASSLSR